MTIYPIHQSSQEERTAKGANYRLYRESLKLSIKQAAKQWGIKPIHLARIERGEVETDFVPPRYQTLHNADPTCVHNVEPQWSGVKCTKCGGWFCH